MRGRVAKTLSSRCWHKAIGRQVRWPEAVIFRYDGETTGCVPRQPDAARQRGRERPAVATLGGRAVKGCEMSCGLRAL